MSRCAFWLTPLARSLVRQTLDRATAPRLGQTQSVVRNSAQYRPSPARWASTQTSPAATKPPKARTSEVQLSEALSPDADLPSYLDPDPAQLAKIFAGSRLDDDEALQILREQHEDRIDDALDGIDNPDISNYAARKARIWLNHYHPLTDQELLSAIADEEREDRDAAAAEVAKEKIRAELVAKAERWRLVKKTAAAEETSEDEEDEQARAKAADAQTIRTARRQARSPQQAVTSMRYSILERNQKTQRIYGERRRAQQEEHRQIRDQLLALQAQGQPMELALPDARQQRLAMTIANDITNNPKLSFEELRKRLAEIRSGKRKPRGWEEFEESVDSGLKEPPKMSVAQRLSPSLALVLGVVGGCYGLVEYYQPVNEDYRLLPGLSPSAATIIPIIIANVGVLAAWRLKSQRALVPALWRHFVIITAIPRASSMIGSVFSHMSPLHLATNMTLLYYVGTRYFDEPGVGRGGFLATLLACGAISSYVSLAIPVLANKLHFTSLGASGAVCGLAAAWLMMGGDDRRYETILLPHEWQGSGVPGRAIVAIGLSFELIQAIRLLRGKPMSTNFFGHLGGWTSGAAVGHWLKTRQASNDAKRDEKAKG